MAKSSTVKRPSYVPKDYDLLKVVGSLKDMFNAGVGEVCNVVLFPRKKLSGDFNGLARRLWKDFGDPNDLEFPELHKEDLEQVVTSLRGRQKIACQKIIDDIVTFESHGFHGGLRLIVPDSYMKVNAAVHEFHGDVAEGHRLMCCYNAPVTEALRNDEAVYKGIRTTVSGRNEKEFPVYKPEKGAKPFSFGVGDIWYQVSNYWSDVDAFIHRAVETKAGDPPRLLFAAT